MSSVTFADVLALETPDPSALISYGGDPNQRGELWLPDGRSKGLVIFIHGGCWLNEYDVRHSRPLCSALARSGITTYALEYRRIGDPGGGYPGTFDDVTLALDTVAILEQWHVGTTQPLLVGHSAGGHLALWAAAAHPEAVRGAVGLAAIADLERYSTGASVCEQATAKLLGGTAAEVPERYARYSPQRMKLHERTLLVHGNNDDVVPPDQIRNLPLPPGRIAAIDAGHYDLIHPGTNAFASVLETILGALR